MECLEDLEVLVGLERLEGMNGFKTHFFQHSIRLEVFGGFDGFGKPLSSSKLSSPISLITFAV